MEVFDTLPTVPRSLIDDSCVGLKNHLLVVIHSSSRGMDRVSHTSGENLGMMVQRIIACACLSGMVEMIMPYCCKCFVLGHENAEIFWKTMFCSK